MQQKTVNIWMSFVALLFLFIVRTATKAVGRQGKIMSLGGKKTPNLLEGGKRDRKKKYFCQNTNTRV